MGDERVTDRIALWAIGLVSSLVVVAMAFLLLGRRPQIGTAPDVSTLPVLNALLNATSAVLLLAGYLFIRQRKVTAHKACMLTAFGVSSLFLVSYVLYHYYAGSKPFQGHEYFQLRINLDVEHGRVLQESLLRWATTEENQDTIRRGAQRSLEARATFWSALEEELFPNPLSAVSA